MKKVALFLMIMVLGAAVFAAPAKTPVLVSTNVAKTASMRIGALTVAAPGGLGSIPTIGWQNSPTMSWDVGLAIAQNAAGANTNFGILLRLENELFRVGDLKVHLAGNLLYATNPGYAAAATPSTTINVAGGVEYELLKNLTVLSDLTLLEVTSTGGKTQLGVGAGTASGTGLGTVSIAFYNGLRLYF